MVNLRPGKVNKMWIRHCLLFTTNPPPYPALVGIAAAAAVHVDALSSANSQHNADTPTLTIEPIKKPIDIPQTPSSVSISPSSPPNQPQSSTYH